MGLKDRAEKMLLSKNEIFADISNALLYKGEQVISPLELEELAPRSFFKDGGKLHELERDVIKCWKNGQLRIACIGFENQSAVDANMPIRVIGYDGTQYRAQLNSQQDFHYPVVTLVLYFGNTQWSAPRSLKECLKIPKDLEPFVSNYKINVFQIAHLSYEQVELFKSDFKMIADFLVHNREHKGYHDYHPINQELIYPDETIELLSVLTNDERINDVYNDETLNRIKGKPTNMCELYDRIEGIGFAKGEAQGIAQGMAKGKAEGIAVGKAEGEALGLQKMSLLVDKLFALHRFDDVQKATKDQEYCAQLMMEFAIN